MGSYFPFSVPDNESSTGGSSSLSTGITLAAPMPSTMFQCYECSRLFLTEAAFLEHQVQSNLLCSYATKALSFLRRFGLTQQATPIPPPLPNSPTLPLFPSPPQRPYYQTAPLSLSLILSTAEGSATHDPFGDDHKPPLETLDLVSRFNIDYVGPRGNEARYGEEELDVELKL